MNQSDRAAEAVAHKPRVALMGEFSAGKSTLSNLLLGADPLPVRVTATRLAPVWISYGDKPATREDLDGNSHEIDINQLETVDLEQTRLIRLWLKSDVLHLCDLIDMPGISDPNMQASVWQSVIGEADHVIWCSHATQAWRQSEAAVWESLPKHLRQKSLLLLTRFDKLLTPRDRDRVMARVRREVDGLFCDVFPVSLTQALVAGKNRQAWEDSGAEPFVLRLVDLLSGRDGEANKQSTGSDRAAGTPEPSNEAPQPSSVRVMPSRVRAKAGGQKRPRCRPQENTLHALDAGHLEMSGNV